MDKGNNKTITIGQSISNIKNQPVRFKVIDTALTDADVQESVDNPGTMYITQQGIMMAGLIVGEANSINDVAATTTNDIITLTKKTNDEGPSENIITGIASQTYVDNAVSAGFATADALVLAGTIDAQTNIQNWNEHAMGTRPTTVSDISIFDLPKYVSVSAGYTFKFTAPNTNIFGQNVEEGDVLIIIRDIARDADTGVVTSTDIVIIQSNIDTQDLTKRVQINGGSFDFRNNVSSINLDAVYGTTNNLVTLQFKNPYTSAVVAQVNLPLASSSVGGTITPTEYNKIHALVNNGTVPTAAISASTGTDGAITFDQYKQINNALFWQ